MTGLLIVAHAAVGRELIRAAEMIMGTMERVVAVDIAPGDTADDIQRAISQAVGEVAADGAIILTDMFGGTPSNISLSFLREGQVEVVTGVNLPMVIKFANDRERKGVAELATSLRESGREAIIVAGDYLR
jgi:PTS system mannose-specific IIA component